MNAVEIEQAITELAERPFDATEFPFAFLEAFGNKPTTLKRLRTGAANKSDLGGVLQTGNIHILAAEPGGTANALACLQESPATHNKRLKVRFLLATDGATFEAVDQETGETVACDHADFPDHFGFFLPLAGISTVKVIRENAFDVRATARLNRLYLKLLEENPDWGTADRRHDLNHFFARLIFCFFTEDTDILVGDGLFTATVERMADDTNTAWVISEIFRAMNTPTRDRAASGLRPWADAFPNVNGGLFLGSVEVPTFSRLARSYLIHIGNLDWKRINPDIFGSMIQAVADDEERGALGMHYTSVPNILKVLNPLFLDDLRARLEEAGDNGRKLLNLRKRMARIRVFDPACGSGNFLVIAYKEMRAIEAEANRRRGEAGEASAIPLTNFRGIEIRDFSAEIARLALIIAEYQCDVLYRGQKEALAEVLPLDAENWITCGNALRLDWPAICPPTGTGVKVASDDLFGTPLDQSEIDFENEGGETYICGNPPYKGGTEQGVGEKSDMEHVFSKHLRAWKSLDYILAFFWISYKYIEVSPRTTVAFVSTNSAFQGEQVARFWPGVLERGVHIFFAVSSFKWKNLAKYNAGVSVVIAALRGGSANALLVNGQTGEQKVVENINAYLVPFDNVYVEASTKPRQGLSQVVNGSKPADGGGLIFGSDVANKLASASPENSHLIRPFYGAHDATHGRGRYCVWADEQGHKKVMHVPDYAERFSIVRKMRQDSSKSLIKAGARFPYAFQQVRQSGNERVFQIPRHSSEDREFYPFVLLPERSIVGDGGFSFFDPELWNLAILGSRMALAWIACVCGKIKDDYRFSNTLGWNTFPVPTLTQKNRDDLTACAEAILLTREAHFPATIADLYDPERMPEDLRAAHDANDEMLERIYIGR